MKELWYTDRSRYVTGFRCPRERYLRYHSSPKGYGIARTSMYIALSTGTWVHSCIADILNTIVKDPKADENAFRDAIRLRMEEYRDACAASGLAHVEEAEQQYVINEQACLIEGLVWAWIRVMLPIIQAEFDIICIETEEKFQIGPICMLSRPDLLLRRKEDGTIGNHDFKTAGMVTDSWIEEWRNSIQMAVGTVGAEERLGEKVTHYFMHALIKGTRSHEYDLTTQSYTGPKRQRSPLCYLYHRPANLPTTSEDFQASWKYVGKDGKNHTLGRTYIKTPVWEMQFPGKPDDVTNAEFWARSLPESEINQLFMLIGPYQRQDRMIESFKNEMPAVEMRWLENLHSLAKVESLIGYGNAEFQALLDSTIPRSYDCFKWGTRCSFHDICIDRIPGWDKPLSLPHYEERTSHHDAEEEQIRRRTDDANTS